MLRSIDFSRAGMLRHQQRLDLTAQNIAGSGVPGFKISRADLETGENNQPPGPFQTPSLDPAVAIDRVFSQGAIHVTGSPWDMAIDGTGFFVLRQDDGSTAYTRNGAFHVNSSGLLVDDAGRQLQPGLSVPPGTIALTVGPNGSLLAQSANGTSSSIGTLQLAVFPNANGLAAAGDGVYVESQASGAAILLAPGNTGAGLVRTGALEDANVDLAAEMGDLLAGQRAYQLNMSAFQIADQMLQLASQMQNGA